jgi:hypothetical protein
LADNRLSLIVSFTGNDKLSGAIRNLIGLGATAIRRSRACSVRPASSRRRWPISTADRQDHGQYRRPDDQPKDLAAQLEKVNAQIDRQKALNAFHADTAASVARRGPEECRHRQCWAGPPWPPR